MIPGPNPAHLDSIKKHNQNENAKKDYMMRVHVWGHNISILLFWCAVNSTGVNFPTAFNSFLLMQGLNFCNDLPAEFG